MRYSIMLQLVAAITFILLGSAALFAWLQYRPAPEGTSTQGKILYLQKINIINMQSRIFMTLDKD